MKNKTNNKDSLLTVEQASKFLGVSPITLRRWDDIGTLKALRTDGNQRRYRQEDLENIKNSQGRRRKRIYTNHSQTASAQPRQYLTPEQAAEQLGVSVDTLTVWDQRGSFVAIRTADNELRYTNEQIAAFQRGDSPNQIALQESPPSASEADEVSTEAVKSESLKAPPSQPMPDTITLEAEETALSPGKDSTTPNSNTTQLYQDASEDSTSSSFFSRARVYIYTAVPALLVVIFLFSLFSLVPFGKLPLFQKISHKAGEEKNLTEILGVDSSTLDFHFTVNVPSEFKKVVTFDQAAHFRSGLQSDKLSTFSGGIVTNNANGDFGTGIVIASNIPSVIVSGISGGQGVSVGTGTTPTITNTGVLSVNGSTGAVSLTAGSGISISGTTISSTVSGTSSDSFKNLAVSGQDTLTAGSSTDTLTLVAGPNVSLSTNSSSKSLTIGVTGVSSQWTTIGSDIYYTTGNVGIGTTRPLAALSVSGTASVSGDLVFGSAATITTTSKRDLTIGSATSGDLYLYGFVNCPNLLTDVNGRLACGSGGGGSGGIVTLQVDDVNTVTSATVLNVLGSDFDLSNPQAGKGSLSIDYANSGIVRRNLSEVIGGQYSFLSDVLIGGTSTASARFAFLNAQGNGTPTASIAGNLMLNSAGVLQTTNNQTLTIGGNTTGNIVLSNPVTVSNSLSLNGDKITDFTGTGLQMNGTSLETTLGTSVDLTAEITGTLPIANGGTNATALGSAGSVAYSNGTSYAFTALGTTGQVLVSNGSAAPSWADVSGISYWVTNNGTIYPKTASALDLLIGGEASSSAKFAVLNVNNGTPTASVSSGLNGTALYLAASGVLQTANRGTLTIGGNTTGNISLANPVALSSSLSLGGDTITDFTGTGLQMNGTSLETTLGTSVDLTTEVTGTLPIANGGTNATALGSAGTIAYSNGTSYAFTSLGTSGYLLASGGSGAPTWIDPNTLSGTNYWVTNNGTIYPKQASVFDLLIGGESTTSAKFAFINTTSGTPTASISGNIVLNSLGSLQTTNGQTLTIGGNTTGNILLSNPAVFGSSLKLGTDTVTDLTGTGLQMNGTSLETTLGTSVDLTTEVTGTLPIANGGTNATALGSAGTIAYSNGTGYAFTSLGTSGYLLASGGSGSPTWIDPSTLAGTNYFDLQNGAINPKNSTVDFLIGGTSSTSAKFAFLNVNSGVATASIAGNLVLNTAGSLQTTNNQILTIGGNTTGNILLSNAVTLGTSVALNGDRITDFTGTGLQMNGTSLETTLGTSVDLTTEVTGTLPIANGGTNATALGSAGSVAYSNGTSYAFSAIGNPGQVLVSNGSGAPSWQDASGVGTNYWLTANGTIYPQTASVLDLLIGGTSTTSAKFAFINVNSGTPTASISGNIVLNSLGSLQTTNNQTLTIGGNTTGNILLNNPTVFGSSLKLGTDTITDFTGTGLQMNGTSLETTLGTSVDLTTEVTGTLPIANGGTNATALGSAGTIAYSDGTGYAFSSLGVAGQVLVSGGSGAPTWTNASTLGTNYFDLTNGAINPKNTTLDFLIGGVSTASAKFAFLNVNSGIPTASIAGNLVLNSAGNLQTTNNQLLTIGGNTTGDILLSNAVTFGTSVKLGVDTLTDFTGNGLAVSGNALSVGLLSADDSTGATSSRSGLEFGGASGNELTLLQGCADGEILKWNESTSSWACSTDAGGGAINTAVVNIKENDVLITTQAATLDFLGSDFNAVESPQGEVNISIDYGNSGITRRNQNEVIGGQWSFLSDLLIGGTSTASARFAFINAQGAGTPTASIGGNLVLSSAGLIQTTNNQTLTIGGNTTGNLVLANPTAFSSTLSIGGDTISDFVGTGLTLSSGVLQTTLGTSVDLTSEVTGTLPIANGGTNATSLGSAGSVAYSNGTSYAFSAIGNPGQVLVSNGSGAPTWADASGVGINYWSEANGTIYPKQASVYDLLIGGESTASAKFAFINTTSGTPTASIAGNLVLNSAGSLQTTNGQTLTIGGTTTGNIVLANSTTLTSGNSLTLAGLTGNNAVLVAGSGTGLVTSYTTNTAGQCLVSGTNNPVWSDCAASAGDDWNVISGTLSPKLASTLDLLLGGVSTSSAKFAVTGIDGSATPFASVSATTGLQGGIVLGGDSTIQSLRNNTLTIGGNTTGNIVLTDNTTITSGNSLTLAGITGNNAVLFGTSGSGLVTSAATDTVGQCLVSGTNNPAWTDCATAASGANYWDIVNGTITPKYSSTLDFLLGGVSTASAKFAVLNVNNGTPTASVSSGLNGTAAYISADGKFQTADMGTLTLGGSTTGDIVLSPRNGSGTVAISGLSSGAIYSNGGIISSESQLSVTRGGTGLGSFTTGDLIYASNTNTLAARGIGTAGQALVVAGGVPTWADTNTSSFGLFNLTSGAIYPNNPTVDFLLGGTSTTSAKFAFINNAGGTPTASISGNLILNSLGSLQTTNDQTLTIGGNTTGNIALANPVTFSSSLTLNGDKITDFTGTGLQMNGTSLETTLGTSVDLTTEVTGTLPIANGGTNATALGSAGTVAYSNGTSYAFTALGNAGQVLISNGSSAPSWADASGIGTNYWVTNNGTVYPKQASVYDLLIGGESTASAKFAFINTTSGTPTASIAGNIVLNSLGSLQTTNNQTLTIGGNTTGTILVSNAAVFGSSLKLGTDTITDFTGTGLQMNGTSLETTLGTSVDLTTEVTGTLPIANGGTNATALGSAGTIAYSNGTSYAFTALGTSGYVLTSNGSSAPTWTDPSALGTNYFDLNNGALNPKNSTLDLLIGGVSTASAKFAFINNASGIPTASIAGNLVLNSVGSLQTTNNQTLTIGGNTTGNILLSNAVTLGTSLTLNGDTITDFTGTGLQMNGTSLETTLGTSVDLTTEVTGTLPIANGGTNATTLGSAGTVAYSNGTGYAFTALGSTGQVLVSNGSSAPTWVDATTLNGSYFNLVNGTLYPKYSSLDLLIGGVSTGSAKFAFINVNSGIPTASISGNIVLNSAGSLQTTNNQTLTLGGNTTGNILLNNPAVFGSSLKLGTDTITDFTGTGLQMNGTSLETTLGTSVDLTTEVTGTLPIANGGTNATVLGSAGTIAYSNGTSYAFTSLGTTGQALISGGTGTPTWLDTNTGNFGLFDLNTNAIFARNSTYDFLLGGNATSSAKFSVLNMAGGTPTASISAGANNIATYLSGTGVLGTTANQNLTLGAAGTGNITLAPNGTTALTALANGSIGIGTTAPIGLLNVSGVSTGKALAILNQTGNQAIFAASSSGATRFLIDNIGRIGIGTTVPKGLLQISGNGNQNAVLSVNQTGTNANDYIFTASSSGTTKFVIDNSGNVGIGTSAPGNQFSINAPGTADDTTTALITASSALNKGLVIQGATSQTANLQEWQQADGSLIAGINPSDFTFYDVAATPSYGNSGGTGDRRSSITASSSLTMSSCAAFNTVIDGVTGNQSTCLVAGQTVSGKTITFDFGTAKLITEAKFYATNTITFGNWKWQGSNDNSTWTDIGGSFTLGGSTTQTQASLGSNSTPYRYYQLIGVSGSIGVPNYMVEFEFKIAGTSTAGNTVLTGGYVGIGTNTLTHKLNVNGAVTGKALALFNETGDQDLFTASASGTTKFVIGHDGTITAAKYGTGVAQFSSAGVLSSSALNLGGGSSYISGTLPIANGGTNATALGSAGTVAYSDGTGYAFTALGTTGQVLLSNGSSAPTWTNTNTSSFGLFDLNTNAIFARNSTYDLLLGGSATNSAKFSVLNMAGGTPTASISAGANNIATYLSGTGVLGTTANQNLTLGAAGTGNITLAPNGTTALTALGNGSIGIGTTAPAAALDVRGNIGTTPTASFSATTAVASLVVDNSGLGNLFTASKSGATKFTILNNGNIQANNYTTAGGILYTDSTGQFLSTGAGNSAQCLLGGATPSWGSCGGGTTNWDLVSGAIAPNFASTVDLLIGGTSTASAKFAVLNTIGGGTPTASVSAQNALGQALALSGTGTIQALRNNALTIGGNTTGDIILSGRNGANNGITLQGYGSGVILSGSAGQLTSGKVDLSSSTYVQNTLGVTNGGTGISSFTTGDLIYASNTNTLSARGIGTAGQVLGVSSGAPNWLDTNTSAFGLFDLNTNAIFSRNATYDLLLGGNATISAKFAVLNMAGGTPTASVSATAVTNRPGVSLAGDGTIQALNNGTLTIGGSTTGNIVLSPRNGSSGTVAISGLASGALYSNSGIISSESQLSVTRGGTGIGSFTTGDLIYASNTNVLSARGIGTAGQVLTVSGGVPNWADTNTSAYGLFDLNTNAIFARNSTYDLLLGGNATNSAKFAVLNMVGGTPTASVSATTGTQSGIAIAGDGSIQSLRNNTLTIGGGTTGNIVLSPLNGTGTVSINGLSSGALYSSSGLISSEAQLSVTRGGTGLGSFTTGDLIYASNTNTLSARGIGTAGQVLTVSGGVPTWGGSDTAAFGLFNLNTNAIFARNSTYDLLLGGSATTSAKFAVLNMAGGTPTASVSATSTGTGLVLGGDGTIQALRNNNLILGGSTTGAIQFAPSNTTTMTLTNGNVGIGNTAPAEKLDILGNIALSTSGSYAIRWGGNTANIGYVSSGGNWMAGTSVGDLAIVNNGSIQLGGGQSGGNVPAMTIGLTNVGIGTRTPSARLHVDGTTNQKVLSLVTGDGNQDLFTASVSGSTKFLIDKTGNVGIGVTTPGSALDATATLTGSGKTVNLRADVTPSTDQTSGSDASLYYYTRANSTSRINKLFGVDGEVDKLSTGTVDKIAGYHTLIDSLNGAVASLSGSLMETEVDGGSVITDAAYSATGTVFGGTVTHLVGLDITDLANLGGTVTNRYGLRIASFTGSATNDYGLYQAGAGQKNYFAGNLGIGTTSPVAALDVRGANGTTPVASFSATTAVAGLVVDNSGLGNLFTASKSGAMKFTILNNGNIQTGNYKTAGAVLYTDSTGQFLSSLAGTAGQVLVSGGSGTPTWADTNTGNFGLFDLNTNAIFARNSTYDLLLGGSATSSAKFSVLNMAGGTPTASVSATSTGTGLALGGDGRIQSLRNNNLLLGGTTTGAIQFAPNNTTTMTLTSGNVGIGSTTPAATLDVLSSSATNLMRIGYDSSNYFATAVTSAGAVSFDAVGSSAGFTFKDPMTLGVAGSSNGSLTFQSAGGSIGSASIAMDNSGNLTISTSQSGASLILGGGTGDITLTPGTDNVVVNLDSTGDFLVEDNGTPYAIFDDTGNIGFGTTTPGMRLNVRGANGTTPVASFSATTAVASLVVDNSGLGNLFTASKSGAMKFTILNNGNIQTGNYKTAGGILYTDSTGQFLSTGAGSGSQCLLGGTTPVWGSCSGGTGAWDNWSGALAPQNANSTDLILGGTATSSAKFSVLNMSGGTPVASVSATSGVRGGISLGGDSTIQSLRNNTLTIGGNTTGDIAFKPGNISTPALTLLSNGNIGIGTTSPAGLLTINGATNQKALAQILGDGNQDLFTASASGATKFVINKAGNVGIGTTSPNYDLEVLSTSHNQFGLSYPGLAHGVTGVAQTNTFLKIKDEGNTSGGAEIDGLSSDNSQYALYIRGIHPTGGTSTAAIMLDGSASNGTGVQSLLSTDQVLQVSNAGNALLTIKGSGNVGIGTINPNGMLTVNGTANQKALLQITGDGTQDLFTASVSGSTKFLIDKTGNIGIGTTAPTAKLALSGGNFVQTASGNPTAKSTITLTGNANSIAVQGKYAYVDSNGTSAMDVVDVSDPANPVKLSSLSLWWPSDLKVQGKYAYVADDTHGFRFIDISNPKSPTLINTYNPGNYSTAVYVSGKYAYFGSSADGLRILDISDPTNPKLLGSYLDAHNVYGIVVYGKYAYLAEDASGIKILDISDPTSPTLVASYATSAGAKYIALSGKYLYVAEDTAGLEILDVSNPTTTPTSVGTYNTAGNAYGIAVGGRYAYVGDGSNGTVVIDVSTPSSPTLVGTIATSDSAQHVTLDGKYLYSSQTSAGMQIVDINGAEVPAMYAGALKTDNLNVTTDANINGTLAVANGLNVGPNGILSQGSLTAAGQLKINGSVTKTALAIINETGGNDIFTASASGTTRFVIQNNGNVGIGTGNPNAPLQVGSGSPFTSGAQIVAMGSTQGIIGQTSNSSGWGMIAYNSATSANEVDISGGTYGMIVKSGNVGIGDTAPGRALSIRQQSTDYQLRMGDATNYYDIGRNNTSGYLNFTGNQTGFIGYVFSGGNVGIGTTAPVGLLNVNGTANQKALAQITGDGNQALFTASVSGSTKFVINKSGNVGIGTTAPGYNFDVVGQAHFANTSGPAIQIDNDSSNVEIYGIGTNLMNIYSDAGIAFRTNNNGAAGAGGNEFDFLNGANNGYVTFYGDNESVAIGSTINSTKSKLDVEGDTAGNALMLLNQTGSNTTSDIFTASSSGTTKFRISNTGSVLFQGDTISSIGSTSSGSRPSDSNDTAVINALGDQGSLVPNSGFESALTVTKTGNTSDPVVADGWVAAASMSAQVVRIATDSAKGSSSLLVKLNASQNTAVYSTCIPVATQFANYTLNMYAKASVANRMVVRGYLDAYANKANCQSDTSRTVSTAQGISLTAANTWTQTPNSATAIPAISGTTWARVHIFVGCPASCTGSNTVELDGVRLIEKDASTGVDYAENYPADPVDTPQPGDVVSLGTAGGSAVVKKANTPYDPTVMGVVSTQPGQVLDDGSVPEPKATVALAGRVPVNVTSKNGLIHQGDYLTASDMPGVAMKATDPGQVIGIAMGDYTNTDSSVIGQVTVFIKNTYYAGKNDIYITDTGNLSIFPDNNTNDAFTHYILKNGDEEVKRTGLYSDVLTASLSAGLVDAKKLTINGKDILDIINERGSEPASLSAQQSEAFMSQFADLGSKVDNLSSKVDSIQQLAEKTASEEAFLRDIITHGSVLGVATSSGSLTQAIASLSVDGNGTIGKDLTVLGRTTLGDLGVTGNLTAGLINIDGLNGEINSAGQPLKIQSLATDAVDFMNGKVLIQTNGDIVSKGEVTAKKINIDTTDQASKTLGTSVIKAGLTSVTIPTTAITSASQIFTTATSDTDLPLIVSQKLVGQSFTVKFVRPQTADVKFSWWIVN